MILIWLFFFFFFIASVFQQAHDRNARLRQYQATPAPAPVPVPAPVPAPAPAPAPGLATVPKAFRSRLRVAVKSRRTRCAECLVQIAKKLSRRSVSASNFQESAQKDSQRTWPG